MNALQTNRGKVCALTGHRDIPQTFDGNALYDALERLIKEGYDCFLCGMAQGFDLLALGCLADLKRRYKITVEACIPYAGQENGFTAEEKTRYRALLAWCDVKTVLFDEYRNGCFLARDRYMVDCADALLAYCVKQTGGTVYTVRYAEKKGISVRFIGERENG